MCASVFEKYKSKLCVGPFPTDILIELILRTTFLFTV